MTQYCEDPSIILSLEHDADENIWTVYVLHMKYMEI